MECTLILLVLILSHLGLSRSEQVIQTFDGEVGAGNFTYFTLKREGEVTLILESVEGDADIYISQETLKPDFENYDLKSATCGEDIVTIPADYKRPIGISVFGHVHSPLSKYTMIVLVDYAGSVDGERYDGDEPEESLIWTIFVSVLKIILEILL